MKGNGEVIALLLGEGSEKRRRVGQFAAGALRLIRDASGRVSLEAVRSQEEFERTARDTGCFRRGKPIVDPETRDVIGYEMEEVPLHALART